MKLYFAYGSNMNVDQMEDRCPNAIPVAAARLADWRLLINRRGVATIEHAEGAAVWGAVWNLSKSDEETLDVCEGVRSGAYAKAVADVVTDDGETVEALVYVDLRNERGEPREGYLERCIEGAREWGIDEAVADLEGFKPRTPRTVNRKPSQADRDLSEWLAGLY